MPRSKAIPRLPNGRPPLYDWPVLLNGTPRVLRRGEDFDVSVSSFRAQVYVAANRLERSASTKLRKDGSLFLQGGPKRFDFDFDSLFDGAEHALFRETHFHGNPATFAEAIRAAAKKAGVTIGVQVFTKDRLVIVRAEPSTRRSRHVNNAKVQPVPPPAEPAAAWQPKRVQLEEPSPHQHDCTCPWRNKRRVGVDRACPRHGLPSATITDQS